MWQTNSRKGGGSFSTCLHCDPLDVSLILSIYLSLHPCSSIFPMKLPFFGENTIFSNHSLIQSLPPRARTNHGGQLGSHDVRLLHQRLRDLKAVSPLKPFQLTSGFTARYEQMCQTAFLIAFDILTCGFFAWFCSHLRSSGYERIPQIVRRSGHHSLAGPSPCKITSWWSPLETKQVIGDHYIYIYIHFFGKNWTKRKANKSDSTSQVWFEFSDSTIVCAWIPILSCFKFLI